VKGFCEAADAGAAPKVLASGSPKIAISSLPFYSCRAIWRRQRLGSAVLLAFGR
jgi:hypothetical protein